MKGSRKRIAFVVASALLLTLAFKTWAAPASGAAHSYVGGAGAQSLPFAARFRVAEGRGLLVNVWINDRGPYTLAIDTGAGATILSERVAQSANVRSLYGRRTPIGGLSGVSAGTGVEAKVNTLAIGDRNNYLPARSGVIVTGNLPVGVDGVLDPTESYWPLGYSIDFPQATITAFDPRATPLRANETPAGGTVVQWIFQGATRRPFVALESGHKALIDTGSGFGLAMSEAEAQSLGIIPRTRKPGSEVRDLGGGRVSAHRISPLTIRVGSMSLRNVPTDLLYGAEAGAPILLGRDALRPFKLSFDPLNRLISISPR
jgi:predicted aspartyl protease